MTTTLFRNAAVLNVHLGEIRPDQSVIVEDGLIREVGPSNEVRVTDPDRVIDVKGRTLMPGLVDGHVHVYFQSFDTRSCCDGGRPTSSRRRPAVSATCCSAGSPRCATPVVRTSPWHRRSTRGCSTGPV
ncbi:amidohydrolase family protein [Corynebacterium sp. AOP12-C2-36]